MEFYWKLKTGSEAFWECLWLWNMVTSTPAQWMNFYFKEVTSSIHDAADYKSLINSGKLLSFFVWLVTMLLLTCLTDSYYLRLRNKSTFFNGVELACKSHHSDLNLRIFELDLQHDNNPAHPILQQCLANSQAHTTNGNSINAILPLTTWAEFMTENLPWQFTCHQTLKLKPSEGLVTFCMKARQRNHFKLYDRNQSARKFWFELLQMQLSSLFADLFLPATVA